MVVMTHGVEKARRFVWLAALMEELYYIDTHQNFLGLLISSYDSPGSFWKKISGIFESAHSCLEF